MTKHLFAFLLLITIGCSVSKYLKEGDILLRKNVVQIYPHKSFDDIYFYIKPKPNQYFLGFPLKVYWYYKLQNKKENNFFYKLIKSSIEEPSYYNKEYVQHSIKQISEYLKLQGYYNCKIYDSVKLSNNKAKVFYIIKLGQPLVIDSVVFETRSKIFLDYLKHVTTSSLLSKNKIITDELLQNERDRITSFFKKNGFYFFSPDNIYFEVDTGSKTTIKCIILSDIITEKQYIIDSLLIYYNFDSKLALQERMSYYKTFDTVQYGNIYLVGNGQLTFNPKFLNRFCFIQKGDVYDYTEAQKTYEKFMSTNNFRTVNIQFDTIPYSNFLKASVFLTPLFKHSYKFEIEGTNSSGNIGAASNIVYYNRNIFKGAQTLNVINRFLFEHQTQIINRVNEGVLQKFYSFNTFEYSLDFKYQEPNMLSPFISEKFKKNKYPSTIYQLSYNFQHRPDYRRIISQLSFGYEWMGNKNLKHIVLPVDFNLVRIPYMYWKFARNIRGTFLEESFIDHFELGSTYMFVFRDPKVGRSKNNTIYARGKLETCGNILYLLNKRKKTQPFSYFSIPFSQYVISEIDLRYYKNLYSKSNVVYRIFAGFGLPYGNMDVLPFNKRYYIGGGNSLRGWSPRSLGPGAYIDTSSSFFNQSADIKFETNIEYRFGLLWYLEGAIFADAGNIWDVYLRKERPEGVFRINKLVNDLAVSYGLGIRLNFTYFILRFDLGFKGKNPEESKQFLFIQRKARSDDFNFNFGIGYPF
ncbi:MAG: BamA/TamA family outer membrane protein [Bacteroidales bacterium]|nr:BamA/TamA family outer membrane protein [Bacteroidales bacterium]